MEKTKSVIMLAITGWQSSAVVVLSVATVGKNWLQWTSPWWSVIFSSVPALHPLSYMFNRCYICPQSLHTNLCHANFYWVSHVGCQTTNCHQRETEPLKQVPVYTRDKAAHCLLYKNAKTFLTEEGGIFFSFMWQFAFSKCVILLTIVTIYSVIMFSFTVPNHPLILGIYTCLVCIKKGGV